MTVIYKSLGLSINFVLLFLVQSGNGQLGNPCMATYECSSWVLQCVDFRCTCWPPYVPNVGNTLCVVDINGRCDRWEDVCLDENASCNRTASVWGWCNCNEGFIQDPKTDRCQPRLGASCEAAGPACVAGSCINEICQCENGLVASQNDDECGVAIGGTCTAANPNCADPFAECNTSTNICQCQNGYQPVVEDGVTICKVALGYSCEVNSQCSMANSNCEILRSGNGACTCVESYVPSASRTSCLPVASHWPGTCQETRQCSAMFGRYSVCQTGVCACSSGYIYVPEDFGCVPIHSAFESRTSESIKLLAETLSPYLPEEAQVALDEIMDQL